MAIGATAVPFGSLVDLSGPGRYVHWGFIQISVANLILIGLMVVVFVAAVLVPFGRRRRSDRVGTDQ